MTQDIWLSGLARNKVLALVGTAIQRMKGRGYVSRNFRSQACAVGVAPGRVEIGGHHTDYCGGTVLGFAIDRGTVCILFPSAEWHIVSVDAEFGNLSQGYNICHGKKRADINLYEKGHWVRYVFGTILAYEEFTQESVGGPYTMLIVSNLPMGAGLSSSASLELAVASAFQGLLQHKLGKMKMALLAKHAENQYAGLGCGLLDQAVSAFGQRNQVVQIDTITPRVSLIPHKLHNVKWLVVHSGVSHQLTRTDYQQVANICRAVSERACEGGTSLSKAGGHALLRLAKLKEAGTISEQQFLCGVHVANSGVISAKMAHNLRQSNSVGVGHCLNSVHRSLSMLHGVSCAQVDLIQAMLTAHPDVYGASMMGGGGGGALCSLIGESAVKDVTALMKTAFNPPHILEVKPSSGAWGLKL